MNIVQEEFFTCLGMHEFLDPDGYPISSEEKKVCAKNSTNEKGQTYYFVRLNADNNPYTLENFTEYRSATARLLTDTRYKKVNKDTYDAYKMYLKTNNKAYYKDVERRMI